MAATITPHTFRPRDLVGGHLVIDLLNTVTARDAEPLDWLDGYPRLLEWAALTGHFAPEDLAALGRLAESGPTGSSATSGAFAASGASGASGDSVISGLASASGPAAAEQALARVRELREALHDLIAALVHGEAAPEEAVERVEGHWKSAAAAARLTVREGTPGLRVTVETSGLDRLHDEIALQALDLVRALPRERTRVCPGQRCGWLFIDGSRAGRRRWCDMGTCGNAAKGRTHYQRKRAAGTGPT
ncbi:CGNR zinc finger domain-containing protein [Streptomyces sp. NPDC127166]|uniref:CGNR zinc finger domain-containing protein n=1 Tax=Streptomyces sp. NPDC127166 TaxID=3345380 RepID=UPI0036442520